MIQIWNGGAMRALQSMLASAKCRRWAVPHMHVSSCDMVDYARLYEMGFRALLFDKDNTLTRRYASSLASEGRRALSNAVNAGFTKLTVLSNHIGSSDDADDTLRRRWIDSLPSELAPTISVMVHGAKKPDIPMHAVLEHFDGLEAHRIAVIGDRVLTDVVFANRNGMMSILCEPLHRSIADPALGAVVAERWLLKRWQSQGIQPAEQRLVDNQS
jgi:phosphatidylglycerophosphatase GEP4